MSPELKLGDIIRTKREELRASSPEYTLRQLAMKLEISPAHLCMIEKGEALPKPDLIKKLAEALNLNEDELFRLAEQVNPDLTPILTKPGIPAFLRTLDGLSQEQINKINTFAQFIVDQEKNNG